MGWLARVKDGFFPSALRQEVVGLRETLADGWRYQRAAGAKDEWSGKCHAHDRHEARLTMAYHSVEKSLSLPKTRRPFGLSVRERMVRFLERKPEGSPERPYVALSEEALQALDTWNTDGMVDPVVSPKWEPQGSPLRFEQARSFFASRRSVRSFDPMRVPTDGELLKAVALAQNTPSVCNRQPFRIHLYRDRRDIEAILQIQNGATGFSDIVPTLGVVTARRALFVGPDERNQRWVDGGLFAMTFVWACHALGLATCMLNFALPGVSSAKLRRVADIPEGEDIVVLVALGHPAQGARVARSQKRSVDDLAWIHS